MRRLLSEKHLLKKITSKELDNYLSKGWYRSGPTIHTSQYLFLENELYSPIWVRLPLKNYQFRKRLRKIWRKNNDKFTIKIQPINLNAEKAVLFKKYRNSFKGWLVPNIESYLFAEESSAPFNTFETNIYDGDKLIGFSFFDVGENSIASILGIYDPDYQNLSVGFFTMLLEIDYAQRNSFEYFYPGYVVPGYSRFDYKLDIGKPEEVQYFDIEKMNWEPYQSFNAKQLPVWQLYEKYGEICQSLVNLGVFSEILFYPAYEPKVIKYFNLKKVDAPLFISCFTDYFVQPQIMIFYDLIEKEFYLYQNNKMPMTEMNWENSAEPDTQGGILMDFLKHRTLIFKSSSIFDIIFMVKALEMELQKTVFPDFWKGFST